MGDSLRPLPSWRGDDAKISAENAMVWALRGSCMPLELSLIWSPTRSLRKRKGCEYDSSSKHCLSRVGVSLARERDHRKYWKWDKETRIGTQGAWARSSSRRPKHAGNTFGRSNQSFALWGPTNSFSIRPLLSFRSSTTCTGAPSWHRGMTFWLDWGACWRLRRQRKRKFSILSGSRSSGEAS